MKLNTRNRIFKKPMKWSRFCLAHAFAFLTVICILPQSCTCLQLIKWKHVRVSSNSRWKETADSFVVKKNAELPVSHISDPSSESSNLDLTAAAEVIVKPSIFPVLAKISVCLAEHWKRHRIQSQSQLKMKRPKFLSFFLSDEFVQFPWLGR